MSYWSDMRQSTARSRQIAARIVINGNLLLESPVHLGNGDQGAEVDLPLLRDARSGVPLLQGSSLAGALRNYLRAYEFGFRNSEQRSTSQDNRSRLFHLAELLFGGVKGDPEGDQSLLIVDDALAVDTLGEIRDGVRIDASTRTALPDFKYDLELLPPGTRFPLRFELLLPDDTERATALRGALALALGALERGEIPLGARKTRGYGRCRVDEWQITTYALRTSRQDLVAWLAAEHPGWGFEPTTAPVTTLDATLEQPSDTQDKRRVFTITFEAELASPLLIRSDEIIPGADQQPDAMHLRDGLGRPVISGTSLAGVLRARAQRILNALHPGGRQSLLDSLFGRDLLGRNGEPTASRLLVDEAPIVGGSPLVQNRVSIDRFTGGAYDTALFSEAPHIGGGAQLGFTIQDPSDADKGLLLLLLKDLWTGDLVIGGTANVGRGRLRGRRAVIIDGQHQWELSNQNGAIQLPDEARATFEKYVAALQQVEE